MIEICYRWNPSIFSIGDDYLFEKVNLFTYFFSSNSAECELVYYWREKYIFHYRFADRDWEDYDCDFPRMYARQFLEEENEDRDGLNDEQIEFLNILEEF